MKICKGCRKYERHYSDINYHGKDKYRKYDTKWDAVNKLWYWIGFINKMPEILISKRK